MTYSDIMKPKNFIYALIYDFFLVIFSFFLIVFSSRVVIPLPFTPVPITMQTFAVLLSGIILGSKNGVISVLIFIFSGIAGLPVFAAGNSGIFYLSGPTGGYIIGFIIASFLTGFFAERDWDRKIHRSFFLMFAANISIYIPGLIWLGRFTGYRYVLHLGFFPFIIGDIIKIIFATIILHSRWGIVKIKKEKL